MTSCDWAENDHTTACDFLSEHEPEAAEATLLECGDGVTAVLPRQLPALGLRFHGAFMLAPLPVFIACAALLPVSGFTGAWQVTPTTLAITVGCLALIGALVWVIRMVLRQRELFPRIYFVTLGPKGVAMHFSRLHFPTRPPRTALPWDCVRSVETDVAFCPPALWTGRLQVPVLHLRADNGSGLFIPLPPPEQDPGTWSRVRAEIESRMT